MVLRSRPTRLLLLLALFSISCGRHEPTASLDIEPPPSRSDKDFALDADPYEMTQELEDVTRRLTNTLSTCWLQAGVKELEYYHYWKTGSKLAFSVNYVMLSAIKDRFDRLIYGAKLNEADLQAGGQLNEVRRLVSEYGLIPETSWNGPSPDWAKVARKTVTLARKYAHRMKNLSAQEAMDALLDQGRKDLDLLLTEFDIGPPNYLVVNGERVSPIDYANSFIDEDFRNFILYVPQLPTMISWTKETIGSTQDMYETSNMMGIQKVIKINIDLGRPAVANIRWPANYISDKRGVLSFQDRPFPDVFQGHVVNFVGYKTDKTGQFTALKFENTWGRRNGYRGMYYMTWKQFEVMFESMSIQDGYAFAKEYKIRGRAVRE